MRVLIAALACVLSATLAGAPAAAQETRARVGLPGYKDSFPIEDVTAAFELSAPMARSHEAIKAAFAGLGIPLDRDEPSGLVIGAQNLSARITFAGYRMAKVFDCGSNTMGQNADSFRVTIVFLALLDPVSPTKTRLRIGVIGGGEPVGGSRSHAVQCASTGVLEARLVELANKQLGAP